MIVDSFTNADNYNYYAAVKQGTLFLPNAAKRCIISIMKIQYVWIIIAVLCVVYGFLIFSAGSGTGFFAVWFGLGGIFLLLAFFAHIHLWSSFPSFLKVIIIILLAAGLGVFVFIEARITAGFMGKEEKDLDVIIVLGAQVYEDRPSTVLKYRLDKAIEYLNENKNTVCIVSGGQGPNEPFPEAEGMEDYLTANGIPKERILTESRSKTTRENMEFSKALFDPENDSVGIITNDFHMYRACELAKKTGIANTYAIPAGSTPLYLPSNMLREFFAVLLSHTV